MMLGNVGKLLLLEEESKPPAVTVQSLVSQPSVPAATVSAQIVASGQMVQADPGQALHVPAAAPAVVVKAVPAPKSKFAAAASVAQVVLAGLYSVVAPYLLDAALTALTTPGALGRLGISHEGLSVALFGMLVMWRDARRRKKEAKES